MSPAQYFAALFANPANLPTVPKVVQQLIQSFSRDDVSVEEIAGMLAADPVSQTIEWRLELPATGAQALVPGQQVPTRPTFMSRAALAPWTTPCACWAL